MPRAGPVAWPLAVLEKGLFKVPRKQKATGEARKGQSSMKPCGKGRGTEGKLLSALRTGGKCSGTWLWASSAILKSNRLGLGPVTVPK